MTLGTKLKGPLRAWLLGFACLLTLGAWIWSLLPNLTLCNLGGPAQQALASIRRTTQELLTQKNEGCPTYAQLQMRSLLKDDVRPFDAATVRIFCSEEEVSVQWVGADGTFGTQDDVWVPGG